MRPPAWSSPYPASVALLVDDIAAELRRRLPDLPTKKMHKLLYYCQGHHVAATGEPLFPERVSAWDMGPVVGGLWKREQDEGPVSGRPIADEAALNTIGYVVSRYGALTGADLETLTHGESPWQTADSRRQPGESARIEVEWMQRFFTTRGASGVQGDDDTALMLDADAVRALLGGAEDRRDAMAATDDARILRARLQGA